MKLFLCEKPSQARDIAAVLGNAKRGDGHIETAQGVVTWCLGHLLEQYAPEDYREEWKAWRAETLPMVPERWQVNPRKEAAKQLRAVRELVKRATIVVIATDADREGEMIGREVLEYVGYRGRVERLWLSALDPESIKRALARIRPGKETESLYFAALARSRADWLVGMNLSRAATLAFGNNGTLSIGRVQTPTLALVVTRDQLIENFVSRKFYELAATVKAESGTLLMRHAPPASPEDLRIYERDRAAALAAAAQGKAGALMVKTERKRQGPPKLFSLSTLQKACNKKWGWSADKTLKVAQALYETHKATTYPRSDCAFLPNEQEADVGVITAHLRARPELAPAVPSAPLIRKSVFDSAKVTAHHAIIPTTQAAPWDAMEEDERKAYVLIARHYLAALWPDMEYDLTTVELDAGVMLRARGRVTLAQGWRTVFGNEVDDEDADNDATVLPAVKDGERGEVLAVKLEEKETTPPPRYTEGTLIGDMAAIAKYVDDPKLKARLKETSGIGTEATRASIIEVLKHRGYLNVKGKQILSTEAGRALIRAIPRQIADPGETAVWEEQLELIADGKASVDGFVNTMAGQVRTWIDAIRSAGAAGASVRQSEHACPSCGKGLRQRKGANGVFWGCSGYPECRYTAPDAKGKPGTRAPAQDLGATYPCPQCAKPLRQRVAGAKKSGTKGKGKSNTFWGCSSYPQCRYTAPDDNGKPGVRVSAERTG